MIKATSKHKTLFFLYKIFSNKYLASTLCYVNEILQLRELFDITVIRVYRLSNTLSLSFRTRYNG